MKLKELLQQFDGESVAKRIVELYPFDIGHQDKFAMVFNTLMDMTPDTDYDELSILVKSETTTVYSDGEQEIKFFVTTGVSNDMDGFTWSIEYLPWSNWLNMEVHVNSYFIDDKVVDELTLSAAILWEMTFAGFSVEEVAENAINMKKDLETFDPTTIDDISFNPITMLDVLDDDEFEIELRQDYEREKGS